MLRNDLGYELHKPTRQRFPTLPVLVFEPDEQWAADLIDVQKLSKWNKGVKYLLCVVDVFSKFVWVQPVKNKMGKTVVGALAKILMTGRHPQKLQTDDGKEFYNSWVKKVCEVGKIQHFSTAGDTIASVAERFIRTLKQRLYRYLTTSNTMTYLGALQHLVTGYNATYHRNIGMPPNKVNTENTPEVWDKLYGKKMLGKRRKPQLRVGDKVRVNKKHRVFEKGYMPGWTEEVFFVKLVDLGVVPSYKVVEWDGTPIRGTFYGEDLQKVSTSNDDLFRVERVIRKKGNKVLVRWLY